MCAALALASGCAPAATVGHRTSVLMVPVGRGASSGAERAVRRRITDRSDLELVGLSRLASLAAGDTGQRDEDAEMDAEQRIEQAEDAFSRFDYQGATTQLGEALELLRSSATSERGRRRLASVHLQLAMVLLVHGEHDAALEEIRTCLHLDSRCAPDPARHPPELVTLYEEAASNREATASLEVTTDPPGASATLDGRGPETTPAEWTGLDAGRHYLAVERDGYVSSVEIVSVAAGEHTEREIALALGTPEQRASAALRELESDGVDAEPRWRAQAASLAAADVLLVLSLRPSGMALSAFDGRGAALADALRSEHDDPPAARRWLEATLPPPSVPWYGQWWFWTPVALALSLAFGALTYFMVRTPPVRLIGSDVVHRD